MRAYDFFSNKFGSTLATVSVSVCICRTSYIKKKVFFFISYMILNNISLWLVSVYFLGLNYIIIWSMFVNSFSQPAIQPTSQPSSQSTSKYNLKWMAKRIMAGWGLSSVDCIWFMRYTRMYVCCRALYRLLVPAIIFSLLP